MVVDNENQNQPPAQPAPPVVVHQDSGDGKLGERVARLESTTVTKDEFNSGLDDVKSSVSSSINEAVDRINQKPVPVTPPPSPPVDGGAAPSASPSQGSGTPPVGTQQQQPERKPTVFETHAPYSRRS